MGGDRMAGEGAVAPATDPVDEPWVTRTRLLERLAASTAPVVMVSGPAGSGKSTLAAQARLRDHRPQATIRVTGPLDDPAALAGALLDALAAIGPDVREGRSTVTGVEPEFSGTLLPTLELLAGNRSAPFLLTIDDVHLLTVPSCAELLRALCDGVPPGSTVMLLGRHMTPPWLAPARASDRLLELGPDDLAFDAAEVERMLLARHVLADPDRVAELLAASEGWAVGLYLATRAAAAERRPVAPVHGDDRAVADYLRYQVLDPLDDDLRTFLARTSVLEELSAPLCDYLLQREDSAALLPALARSLQLVVPLDRQNRRFRYHHLLADALRADLAEREPAAARDLHRRASAWFERAGDLDAAIRHAKAADDLPLVGHRIWSGIVACLASGRPDHLQQWLTGLPDRHVASEPWLSLSAAWLALAHGDGDGQTRWLLRCEEHARLDWPDPGRRDEYRASLAAFRAVVGGDLDRMLEDSAVALAGLPAESGFRAPAAFLNGVALTLRRQFEEGRRGLAEAEALGRALDVHITLADALSWQGLLALMDGEVETGIRLIDEATQVIIDNHFDRVVYSAHALTGHAFVLALQHRRPEASIALATARRLTVQAQHIAPWFALIGRLVQARTAILLGDGATARTLVSAAKSALADDLTGTMAEDLLRETESALNEMRIDGVQGSVLTDAELRVLQFLPSHLTFPQIGEQLYVSANTVKTHVLSIYRKLRVSSRADAVDRARTLGLVESLPRN